MKNNYPCFFATRIEHVVLSWKLVYQNYLNKNLIPKNLSGIHIVPNVIGKHSRIILGPSKEKIHYTMTLMKDNPKKLALDKIYFEELNQLRDDGYSLMEVGSLAYSKNHLSNKQNIQALLNMMEWVIHYSIYDKITQIVIGVHPKHAKFYQHYYGFSYASEVKKYPTVNNNLVVLMNLELSKNILNKSDKRGMIRAKNNPTPKQHFSNYFLFENSNIFNRIIENNHK